MIASRRFATTALVVLAFLYASQRHGLAEPTTLEAERGRLLVAEGRVLRSRNDLGGALRAFQSADDLMQSATTSFELAQLQSVMGLLLQARRVIRRVLDARSGSDPRFSP